MIIELDTRRKFARIHFNRHVNLEFISDRNDHRRINNLSLTGMLVSGAFHQRVGKDCFINLAQTGMSDDLCFQASAKVVRKNDEEFAMKFTSMPFGSYMLLQTILLNETDYPFVVEQILPDKCPFEVTDKW